MRDGQRHVKINGVRTFVVGNPTPGYGGRYFVLLKLQSDAGIEGLGECYVASVAPHLVARIVEDIVARHVVGREPFHVEAVWRDVYAAGQRRNPQRRGHHGRFLRNRRHVRLGRRSSRGARSA